MVLWTYCNQFIPLHLRCDVTMTLFMSLRGKHRPTRTHPHARARRQVCTHVRARVHVRACTHAQGGEEHLRKQRERTHARTYPHARTHARTDTRTHAHKHDTTRHDTTQHTHTHTHTHRTHTRAHTHTHLKHVFPLCCATTSWHKIPFNHTFAMQLQDPGRGEPATERLTDYCRVNTSTFREGQGFCYCPNCGPYNNLICRLLIQS